MLGLTGRSKGEEQPEAAPSCPICGAASRVVLRGMYDDRYGYPGMFEVVRCTGCGHAHIPATFDAETLGKLYTDYYPRASFRLEDYRIPQEARGFRAWLDGVRCSAFRWVPPNVRVLDIGCGFGETLGYHRARGCEAHGVEADRNIVAVAERYGLTVKVGLFDPANYEPNYFDYVTMDQVIEHMTDPSSALLGVRQVLRPGGVAILSTPNASGWGARVFGRSWINWHVPYHLHQFSVRSMEFLAQSVGLAVERTFTITSSEWLFYQWLHLLYLPAAGSPSAFWSGFATPKNRDWLRALVTRAHRLKFDHFITRFVDALGLGDSRIFFLRKRAP